MCFLLRRCVQDAAWPGGHLFLLLPPGAQGAPLIPAAFPLIFCCVGGGAPPSRLARAANFGSVAVFRKSTVDFVAGSKVGGRFPAEEGARAQQPARVGRAAAAMRGRHSPCCFSLARLALPYPPLPPITSRIVRR